MLRVFNSLRLIINVNSFICTIVALVCTEFCRAKHLTADFPLTLISIAIVFPIVFSINSAYNRREKALVHLGVIKGQAASLYFAARDWVPVDGQSYANHLLKEMEELFVSLRTFFMAGKDEDASLEKKVYQDFSRLSKSIQTLRTGGLNASEASRVNQYLSKMISSFDHMAIIFHYRTPITLRAYSKIFIYSFPVLYAPYFAHTFTEYDAWLAYIMPVVYCFILVSLDNIQDHLENPYDGIGEDDIKIPTPQYFELFSSEDAVFKD